MSARLPHLDQRLDIELPQLPGEVTRFSTWLDEVTEAALGLAVPVSRGELVHPKAGTPIIVSYQDERAAYRFESQVHGVKDNTLWVAQPTAVQREQRRNFVRWECSLPVAFRYSYFNPEAEEGQQLITGSGTGRTLDLSGGGLGLATTLALWPETRLELTVSASGEVLIATVGRVVRQLNEVRRQGVPEYWFGVQFTGIDERRRDSIIRYIFEQQRAALKRGLLGDHRR